MVCTGREMLVKWFCRSRIVYWAEEEEEETWEGRDEVEREDGGGEGVVK